jgi:membrane fusion protein (multidrug efflux system)
VAAAVGLLAAVYLLVPKRSESLSPREEVAVNVVVQTVRPEPAFADTTRVDGVMEANRVINVAAEIAGRLEAYAQQDDPPPAAGAAPLPPEKRLGEVLKEGDFVQQGQPIVYLNADLILTERDAAAAEFTFDTKDFARIQDAYQRGVATQMEYEQAERSLATSRAQLTGANERLERATIVAPASGVLDSLPVEVGEYVQPGDRVARIVQVDPVKAVAHVSQRDAHYLKIGEEVEVAVDPLNGRRFRGPITYISELANPATLTAVVEITLANPADATGQRPLRSGQSAKVFMTRQTLKDVVLVPLSAVIPLEEGHVVYVVVDGRAEPREVALGVIKGARVQILSGLAGGDQLIVSGQHYVGPGQRVQPVAPN